MKVLIIEDEQSLLELITRSLTKERYVVECASDYHTALQKVVDYEYDCILLDITLPDGNGLKLLEALKEGNKRACVIVVSAKDSLDDKVLGLESGADDYLAKPFHLAELHARIKSVIRRKQKDGQTEVHFGNIKVITDNFQVYVDGVTLDLGRKEYDILLYLINRPDRVVSKTTLAESIWGDHIDLVEDYNFVYAQMKNLRKKLKDSGAEAEIKAVYGFGYKIIGT